jgi:hypothetical protein
MANSDDDKNSISTIQRVLNQYHLKDTWDVFLNICLAIGTAIYRLTGHASDQAVRAFTLIILALLAVNILRNRWTEEKLQQTLNTVEKHLPMDQVHDFQRNAEGEIISYIRKNRVQEAILIQYSISTNADLIKELLEANAKVTLFIQHEDVAKKMGSELQVSRLQTSLYYLPSLLLRPMEQYPLKIYKYTTPGTMSAIKIDREILCMGWYTYECVDEQNRYLLGEAYKDDLFLVFGHNRAAILLGKNNSGFDALEKTFNILVDNYQRNAVCVFPTSSKVEPH